jgi:hypothetical protein
MASVTLTLKRLSSAACAGRCWGTAATDELLGEISGLGEADDPGTVAAAWPIPPIARPRAASPSDRPSGLVA